MRISRSSISASALAAALAALPAAGVSAQETEAAAESEDDVIIVTASRLPGSVDTEVPPVAELDEADIAAAGAGSLDELIEQLAPQTGSGSGRGSGRPVFLVNGQRIANFREIQRYPPEAIQKVEVFPEEVALQYGYAATQRVVNFVLKSQFASREFAGEFGGPTAGGRSSAEVEAGVLTIAGKQRFSVAAEYETATRLTDADRGIVRADDSAPLLAGDADPALYRTLLADTEALDLQAGWNTAFGSGARATTLALSANHNRAFSTGVSGLDTVVLESGGASVLRSLDADPLERRQRVISTQFGAALNRPLGEWNLSVTGDGGIVSSATSIDRRRNTAALQALVDAGQLPIDGPLPLVPGVGVDTASSRTTRLSTLATLQGSPLLLPAGEVSATFDAGYDWSRIASRDSRSAPEAGATVLRRGDLSAGLNVNVPVASAREGVLSALGELGLNFGAGINRLSDFGTLTDWTGGLTWRPSERLSLQASYSVREAAPSLAQLGDPEIVTFNVPTYDFRTGTTVLAAITSGGNPALLAETQRDLKLSAAYEIDLFDRADIRIEYIRNSSRDVTDSFPLLTPAIEAAFDDRVTRDAEGRLVAIDRRPITLAERRSSRLRVGFNVSGRVGKAQERAPEASEAPAPVAAGSPDSTGRDPARFAELRQQLCAPGAAAPDPATLPEGLRARVVGADGAVDPAKLAELRTRWCNADGTARAPGMRMDRASFLALRTALACDDPSRAPDLAALPARIRERIAAPDGSVDPARLAELRTRICAMPVPAEETAAAPRSGREGGAATANRPANNGAGGGGRGPRFGGGRGPGGMMGGGDGQGRGNLSFFHTVELDNTARIAPGLPELDLLDGDALGSGAISRHRSELEGGVFHKGIGLRLSAAYASGSELKGSGLPGSGTLRFSDLATVDARLFVNLAEQDWLTGGRHQNFWKGTRLSLRIDNIFDARQRVTDERGVVPLSYQPGLVDPLGRTFEIDFRKIF